MYYSSLSVVVSGRSCVEGEAKVTWVCWGCCYDVMVPWRFLPAVNRWCAGATKAGLLPAVRLGLSWCRCCGEEALSAGSHTELRNWGLDPPPSLPSTHPRTPRPLLPPRGGAPATRSRTACRSASACANAVQYGTTPHERHSGCLMALLKRMGIPRRWSSVRVRESIRGHNSRFRG
jgi:hypothetical protein